MRAFINCSEPVLDSSQRAFLERFAAVGVRPDQLAASYAMAENVFAVTQTPVAAAPALGRRGSPAAGSRGERPPVDPAAANAVVHVSCGPPIAEVAVRIGNGLPDRSVAEIQVRSHCMLSGYQGRPDLDAGLFADGWYRTGDLGYLADGELYIVGRNKDVIITAGKSLHPHDLETIVNSVAGVRPGRAVVFGVPDEREGTELVAVVAEVDAQDPADRRALGAAIRQALTAQSGIVATYVHLVGPSGCSRPPAASSRARPTAEKWLAERDGAPR